MASIRLRTAAASQPITCMSAPSSSPIMPLGSRTPLVRSSEKPVGSEWSTARPWRAVVAEDASSTRPTSYSDTALPPTAILAV